MRIIFILDSPQPHNLITCVLFLKWFYNFYFTAVGIPVYFGIYAPYIDYWCPLVNPKPIATILSFYFFEVGGQLTRFWCRSLSLVINIAKYLRECSGKALNRRTAFNSAKIIHGIKPLFFSLPTTKSQILSSYNP